MQPDRAVLEHGGRGFLSKGHRESFLLMIEGSNFQGKSQQRAQWRDREEGHSSPSHAKGKGRLRCALEEAKCDGLGYGII